MSNPNSPGVFPIVEALKGILAFEKDAKHSHLSGELLAPPSFTPTMNLNHKPHKHNLEHVRANHTCAVPSATQGWGPSLHC